MVIFVYLGNIEYVNCLNYYDVFLFFCGRKGFRLFCFIFFRFRELIWEM